MSTFAQIRDRTQNMALTEDATTAGIMVNDVYRDLVVQAQLKCTVTTMALTANDNNYTMSGDFGITDLGMVQYIMYKGNGQPQGYILEPSDLETVLQLSSTSPMGYVRKYAFQGLDNMYLWPAPQMGTLRTSGSVTIADNTLGISKSTLAANAFTVSNIAPFTGGFYDITTTTAHGFTAGNSVYMVFPATSNGFLLTNTTFTVVSTSSTTVFRIASSLTITSGAATGYVGIATTYAVQSIGLYSAAYPLITLASGTSYSYCATGSASYSFSTILSGYDSLQIYYAQEPTALSADSDIPTSVPSQWHHMISVGAASRLCDAVGEDVNLSNALQQRYGVLNNLFINWVNNREGRGTRLMQHGYVRKAGLPMHDRSAYVSTMGAK